MTTATRGLRDPRRFTMGTVLLYIGALDRRGAHADADRVYVHARDSCPRPSKWSGRSAGSPRIRRSTTFRRILTDPTLPVFRWLINSLVVAISVTALTLFICSLTGYAYARLEFPGRDAIFFLLLTSLMIPGAVTFIPNFLLMRNLGWLDSYNGLIWLHGANVFGVFLLRQHFQSIPKELEEAAVVDGANRFRIYWQVCLPLVTSAMVALGIFTFLGNWNDLFWPLVIMSDRNQLTLPVGLAGAGRRQLCAAWPDDGRRGPGVVRRR